MVASITISGDKQLEKKLSTLEPKIGRKVVRKSLRVGAKIIQKAIKAEVPKRSRTLEKAVKVRVAKGNRKRTYAVMATTGERGNMFAGKTFYGGFVHFGHKVGKRGNQARGAVDTRVKSVEPNAFIKRAYEKKKQQATVAVLKDMADGIEREAMKK